MLYIIMHREGNVLSIPDKQVVKYCLEENGMHVEYELESLFLSSDSRSLSIVERIREINEELESNAQKLEIIKSEIDKNTSHADKIDIVFAACSGVLCGLIDVFFVGEFNLQNAKAWSNKKVNEFVMNIAKKDGFEGDRLKDAIQHLEDRHKVAHDSSYSGLDINVGSKTHHLDDMAHHPSIVGWIFSLLSQFTGNAFFANRFGDFNMVPADASRIGVDFADKIYCGTVNWFFHLVSDMSGSSKTAGAGMGIPGPILSFAKEIASLPIINKTGLPKILNDLYTKDHFDFRTELAIGHELSRQAIPVLINEVLVRAFYFIRRFINELKTKGEFSQIEWKKILPFKNATITRMLTVASGSFLVVDIGDAALRSGGNWGGFLLRVNFVNVARFTLAVGDEISYAIKREKLGAEYYKQLTVRNSLYCAKLSYQQYAIWLTAKDTLKVMEETYLLYSNYAEEYARQLQETQENLDHTRKTLGIGAYDPSRIESTEDIIKRLKKRFNK